MSRSVLIFSCVSIIIGCTNVSQPTQTTDHDVGSSNLQITIDSVNHLIMIGDESDPALLTQVVKPDHRPYLHPIKTLDGNGYFTEYSPGHHKHQTGIYWGFTRVNGRDYFHNPEGTHWRKVNTKIISANGPIVKWESTYDLLAEDGSTVIEETQIWSVQISDSSYLLDLEWRGLAKQEATISKYDYGGLFVRMPWEEGIEGEVVNAARQKNQRAEGQKAMWVDVGMKFAGRDDWAHVAVFDHPDNADFPQPWRVDHQLGIGPARARFGDWKIEKGHTEIIKHRIVCYTGVLEDVKMSKLWSDYIGDDGLYNDASLWGIAQEEGLQAEFLTPQQAADSSTLMEGFEVNVWTAEPMITQPMAFCWDSRGRLWVVENRDYESRGSGFSNSGDSRILILEDTNRDGQADSRRVFAEGIPFPSAIAVGMGGAFVGAPPNLLFIPDKDQDDQAEISDIEVRLTGWGIRDRHETLNSLHWGPDGWLYGCEGFATPSKVRKPKGKGHLFKHKEPFPEDILEAEGVDIDGGVWRYHPTKDRFEVVAHGFSNPWGIDYDANGQLFITACVIPHMFHIIPGGIYHRQGGKHFNPYVYSDIQTIVDHRHRSAHGGARIYLSDAFPEEYRGQLFMANIHEHAVLADHLVPKGSGFIATHGSDFLHANNAQWIGFSMEIGPEGGLYVLDWHDADICGKEVINKETGRVFRIMPKQSRAKQWPDRYADLQEFSDAALLELQKSTSDWHARRARIVLQGRAASKKLGSETSALGAKMFASTTEPEHRMRYLWTQHIIGAWSEVELIKLLNDSDPYIRAWSIQFLCEDSDPPESALKEFVLMGQRDPSPVVRLYLAAALQKLDVSDRWALANALLQHDEDAEDHNIPKMIWYGIEPLVLANQDRFIELAGQSKMEEVTRHMSHRLVDAEAMESLLSAMSNLTDVWKPLLLGVRDGLDGISTGSAPSQWSDLYPRLAQNQYVAPLALEIAQQFGNAEASEAYLKTLQDKAKPILERNQALAGLAKLQNQALVPLLPRLIQDNDLALEAIRAIANYDTRSLGMVLLSNYEQLNDLEKAEAIMTLASRPTYGRLLTDALKEGDITKHDIPAYVARLLRRVVGNGFVEVWGPIDLVTTDVEASYQKYRNLLSAEALAQADIYAGAEQFKRSCGTCHQMYGEGADIGPDITGSNRTNLEYLLNNLLEPSLDIQDDYKMTIVTTRDGRTFAGNISGESDRQLTLKVVGQDQVVLNKSNIQSREQTEVSMMPAGLLNTISDENIINLIAYLQLENQVIEEVDIQ